MKISKHQSFTKLNNIFIWATIRVIIIISISEFITTAAM